VVADGLPSRASHMIKKDVLQVTFFLTEKDKQKIEIQIK
jgi:hypothetical protein